MRQAGLKDSKVRRVTIVYAFDLFPDVEYKKVFNNQKEYFDWTMTPEAQRYHVKEIIMVMVPDCEFKTIF